MTVGGDSSEPVQIALGELYGDISGVVWPSVSEQDANSNFALRYVEPNADAGVPADSAMAFLAVTRSLFDRGSAVKQTGLVQPRVPSAALEMNSHDAEEWGISDGDRVRFALEGKPTRLVELAAQVDGHVPPGVIATANNLDGTANLPMGARVKVEKV
jgi:predicted molibdopterin-dependent oxidoreductase YjgC